MGDVLFNRAARVLIEDLELTELDIQFRVRRSLRPEPDTLELTIWNLTEEHRGALQRHSSPTTPAGGTTSTRTAAATRAPAVQVRLEAGYRPKQLTATTTGTLDAIGARHALPLLFGGDVREISTTREGPDWVTSLTAGDGDQASTQRTNKAFGRGTPLRFAVEQVCADLGLGLGQLPAELAKLTLFDGGRQFASGVVLSGNGFHQLTRLLATAGYTWTVRDGEIVVVKRGASFGTAVLLTPETGLVGSPTPSNDGRISVQCLLQPDLVPGRQLRVESRHVTGYYVAETCEYTGESTSDEWYVQAEAVPL